MHKYLNLRSQSTCEEMQDMKLTFAESLSAQGSVTQTGIRLSKILGISWRQMLGMQC